MPSQIASSNYRESRIAEIAVALAAQNGTSYGVRDAPVSPHPRLSGNAVPGTTVLEWLRGRYKCNQFVGDTLTYAGFRMPTWRMADGSEHYMHAEALPNARGYFQRVASLEQLQPGDLLVLDWSTKGANGAHVEVVSAKHPSGRIWSTGAHQAGAVQSESTHWLIGARFDRSSASWVNYSPSRGAYRIYLLRPLSPLL